MKIEEPIGKVRDMSKGYKIKRNQKIYRHNRSGRPTVLGVVVVIVAVALLLTAGWALYQPVYDLITGQFHRTPPKVTSEADSSAKGEEGSSSESNQQQTPVTPSSGDVRGVYLPNSAFASESSLAAALDQLKDTGINTVMMDLKDTTGTVFYQSSVEIAKQSGAVSSAAFDLDKTISAIKAKGFKVAARICAFQDPIVSNSADRAVLYQGGEYYWLDNARESGGKTWLNPYSESAQTYLTDLIREVAGKGADVVVLTGVQFPQGFSLEKADYGTASSTVTKADCLKQFVAKAQQVAKGAGSTLYTTVPASAALGVNNTMYAGSPLVFAGDNVLLDVQPASLGATFTSEKLKLDSPVKDPGNTVSQLLSTLKPELTGKNVMAMLQAYTATNINAAQNKDYTKEDIQKQVDAASAAGVGQYILYHPNGQYSLK